MAGSLVLRRALECVHHLGDSTPPWESILTSARDLVGADGASWLVFDGTGELIGLTQVGFENTGQNEYVAHYHAIDTIVRDSIGMPAGSWFDTSEMYSAREAGRDEFFVDFLWRHKMAQVLAFMVENATDLRVSLSFQRSHINTQAKARLSESDVSEYCRAVQTQMAARRARIAADLRSLDRAFSAFDEAVCVVTERGVVRWMSGAGAEMLAGGGPISVTRGRLRHPVPAIQAAIERGLRAAALAKVPYRFSIPLAWGSVIAIDMVRADASYTIGAEALIIMKLATLTIFREPDVQQLELAFAITSAEARALAALVNGHSVSEYAAVSGLSENTVRTHVKHLMRKMDCNRQAEVVKLALLTLR